MFLSLYKSDEVKTCFCLPLKDKVTFKIKVCDDQVFSKDKICIIRNPRCVFIIYFWSVSFSGGFEQWQLHKVNFSTVKYVKTAQKKKSLQRAENKIMSVTAGRCLHGFHDNQDNLAGYSILQHRISQVKYLPNLPIQIYYLFSC